MGHRGLPRPLVAVARAVLSLLGLPSAALLVTSCRGPGVALAPPDAAGCRAPVEALADDAVEGRGVATGAGSERAMGTVRAWLPDMQIVDLQPRFHEAYLHCLEPWAPETVEGRDRREAWYQAKRDRGLIVRLALDEADRPVGMVQAVPAEEGFVESEGLYLLLCIWVHGHKQGVGNHQGRGLGAALLEAVEVAAREAGATGMAAWGLTLPFWMRARWFARRGYRRVDREGVAALMFKAFAPDAVAPRWIRTRRQPALEPDKLTVTCFHNGWCGGRNAACERARRVAGELGEAVAYQEIDTSSLDAVRLWGHADAVLLDHRELKFGPPPSEAALRKKITRAAERRRRPRWWHRVLPA